MSKFFLDTEFIDNGLTIELISIGLLHESGSSFYAVSSECNFDRANKWVQDNVIPFVGTAPRKNRHQIAAGVKHFVDYYSPIEKPHFWGYYSAYDWVVFCQLFGTMVQIPSRYPMYCRDLKQLCDDLGNPDLPKHDIIDGSGHNALSDARWNMRAFEFLEEHRRTLSGDDSSHGR